MDTLADPEVAAPDENGQGPARVALPRSSVNGHAHPDGIPHPGGSGRVLVLNASYEPINVCTVRRATVLLLKDRAEMLEHNGLPLRSERLELDRPCVIRLMRYVRIPRDVHRRKITRKAVLARDAYTCQYCGRRTHGLTVDHIVPRSRGGESIWENIVASCAPCNRRKGNRLPREAQMDLLNRPRAPGPTIFIRIASPRVPVAWEPYLIAA